MDRVQKQRNWEAVWEGVGSSHTSCVEHMEGRVTDAPAFCAWLEHEATGHWPAEKVEKDMSREIPRTKVKYSSDELRIVWAEVYVPNVPDSDGDYMNADTIRKMSYKFMHSLKLKNIDVQHNNRIVPGAGVVESFIARKGDPDFITDAWVVGVHVPDDATWGQIKKGEINGFSIEALVKGTASFLELDIPPVISGRTSIDNGHDHEFFVSYDDEGKFLGGRTDTVDDHFHLIRQGTVTEDAHDHNHRFSHVEAVVGREVPTT